MSAKKPFLDADVEKEKEKVEKPKKLPELDKYWKAVNDDPTDFTGWTYLLQYVDQEVIILYLSVVLLVIIFHVNKQSLQSCEFYPRLREE